MVGGVQALQTHYNWETRDYIWICEVGIVLGPRKHATAQLQSFTVKLNVIRP